MPIKLCPPLWETLSQLTVHPKAAKFFAAQYGYTFPSTLSSIAASTAYIQRRALLHLKKKEVLKLPRMLATCVGQIRWTDTHSNQ